MHIPKTTLLLTICLAALPTLPGCSPAHEALRFDGARAFELLQAQVDLGPRYPGSPGHSKCADLISKTLARYADGWRFQEFGRTVTGKKLAMKNIIGWFDPDASDSTSPAGRARQRGEVRWILLAAHWDTRPTADCEITAEKRRQPILGANDGASGVAVLLELARLFHERKPEVGVLMVFFDGEDYGPTENEMYLGSKHFAANLTDSLSVNGKPVKIDYGIVLDMVGDRDLGIYRERHSVNAARDIVDKVWSAAERLGYQDKFRPEVKYSIDDDHLPLIAAGIKCIDVIDFDYAPWHTLDDTPDKCSAESLKTVGEVIARVVYEERR